MSISQKRTGVKLGLTVLSFIAMAPQPTGAEPDPLKVTAHTPHVFVQSELPQAATDAYAARCEAFLTYIGKNFCPLVGHYPVTVVLLANKSSYARYMTTNVPGSEPASYGQYFGRKNTLYTYNGSGIGTVTHELMHKVCIDANLDREKWAAEGIPTFFEKIYGYMDNKAGPTFYMGYQNPWRLIELDSSLEHQNLATIVTQAPGNSRNESGERLVSVFLWKEGKLKHYADLVRSGHKAPFNTFVEAAFGKSFDKIAPEWNAYIGSVWQNRASLERYPSSAIFDNREEYLRYAMQYNLPTDQPGPLR